MRRIISAISVIFVFASSASAAELTVKECLEINAGFSAIDHYDAPAKNNGQDVIVQKQYLLGPLRGPLARDMSKLRAVADATEKARTDLLAEMGVDKPLAPTSPELAKLNAAYKKILDQPCGVAVTRIKISDLKLGDGPGENQIPPSVLSALQPILDY